MAEPLEKLVVTREKDFVKQNILRAKSSYPAEPKWRSVDTRHGDTYDLKRSGLFPIYVHKKNYGKVPRFVAKADERMETETTERFDGEKVSGVSACRYIDQEERRILLDGMKQKWEEAMKRFRGLPFLADTLPKAQRKARMERELQQLEKDIAIVEQHQHIYVYDDTTHSINVF
ncbi:PREDICTED: enkurin-like [Vollenhovia emeryi]|uniref:enkurin-like n=1 Tax=Vollenhovia emeryi TaxID=411798 RepID=UPI0005F37DCB|nr:PREDICTED: enkurin-like [Vollenhovia emeryi]XP_011879093.1 PREDICTED: enkurin-like [Vollenhovia emeryi]